MAKAKQKTVTVFNTGSRTYSDVYTTPGGKHLDLEPGKSLELPASVAVFLMNGYPREIVSARPGNAEDTKELAGREAAVEKREVAVAEKEQEIGEAGEELEKQRAVVSERTAELDKREVELNKREQSLEVTEHDGKAKRPNAE